MTTVDYVSMLTSAGIIQYGDFTLRSGLKSDVYANLRRLVASPAMLWSVAALYRQAAAEHEYEHICGVPFAALPIAIALGLQVGMSVVYPRPVKRHGDPKSLEGVYTPGDRAIVIDDVATTGTSIIEAAAVLRGNGLEVRDAFVLFTRPEFDPAVTDKQGLRVHSVLGSTEDIPRVR